MLLPSVQAPVSVTCFGCWRASVALAATVTALVARARPLTGYPKGERLPDRLAKPSPVRFGEKLAGGIGCRTDHNWKKDRCATSRLRCRQHCWRKGVLETDAQHMPVIVAWREPPLRGYSSCLLAISLVLTAIYDVARRAPGWGGFWWKYCVACGSHSLNDYGAKASMALANGFAVPITV